MLPALLLGASGYSCNIVLYAMRQDGYFICYDLYLQRRIFFFLFLFWNVLDTRRQKCTYKSLPRKQIKRSITNVLVKFLLCSA